MKIILTADIHNGVPNKVDDCIWSMRYIRDYAHEHNIDVIMVLGDLFHDRVNLNIEVMYKVYTFMKEASEKFGQSWICFPGNHDMFLKNSWEINSLAPLDKVMTIVEDISTITLGGTRFWTLPFIHYESAYMRVLKKIEERHEEGDVLLTHIGVCGASLNICFLLQNWNIVSFENSPFDKVYTGHFHCHQQIGNNVWYPGSPIPFRFDEGYVEHGFLVYDTDTRDHEFVTTFDNTQKERPADFVTVTDDSLEGDFADNNKVRIALSREYTTNELNTIKESFKERGAISVNFIKYKEEDAEIAHTGNSAMSVDQAFDSWLEHDNPTHLNKNLLLKLNDQVQKDANERIVVGMDDD